MGATKKKRKPASSALQYLTRANADCDNALEKARECLQKLGMLSPWHWAMEAALKREAGYRFKRQIEIAQNHWGNLEVEAALRELNKS